jgi:hypothetical protein
LREGSGFLDWKARNVSETDALRLATGICLARHDAIRSRAARVISA